MTATERLRELLDERGVEWDYGITRGSTMFRANGIELTFIDWRDGVTCSTILTPQQAIEATLGPEPDDAAMIKLHDKLNAAMMQLERGRDDTCERISAIAKAHELLEEAATLCSPIGGFWTDDGTLHLSLPELPERIEVTLPDSRGREVYSARVHRFEEVVG